MIDEKIGKIIDRDNGASSLYIECKDTSNSFKILKEEFESYGYEVVHLYSKSDIKKIKNKIQGVRDKTIATLDFLRCSGYSSIKSYNTEHEEKIRPIILAIEDTTKFYDEYWDMPCPTSKEDAELSHMLMTILNAGRATGTTILLICNYESKHKDCFDWLKIDTTKRIRYATRDEVLLNREQEHNKDYTKNKYKYLKEYEYAYKLNEIQTNRVVDSFRKKSTVFNKLNRKILKDIKILAILAILFASFEIGTTVEKNSITSKEINTLNNNIKITAAHLGDIEGYKLIHEDSERDVSYYISNNLKLTTVEKQDVSIKGLENCKVVSSADGEFLVETSTPDKIVNGMSGTEVLDKTGKAIGFVDALVKDKKIKCLTLE